MRKNYNIVCSQKGHKFARILVFVKGVRLFFFKRTNDFLSVFNTLPNYNMHVSIMETSGLPDLIKQNVYITKMHSRNPKERITTMLQ